MGPAVDRQHAVAAVGKEAAVILSSSVKPMSLRAVHEGDRVVSVEIRRGDDVQAVISIAELAWLQTVDAENLRMLALMSGQREVGMR